MRTPAEPSASVASASIGSLSLGRALQHHAVRPLPTETVEFPVLHATDKCVPFVRCKRQNCSFGVPAVADTDAAIR